MKRFLSAILVLCMLVTAVSFAQVTVSAADETEYKVQFYGIEGQDGQRELLAEQYVMSGEACVEPVVPDIYAHIFRCGLSRKWINIRQHNICWI